MNIEKTKSDWALVTIGAICMASPGTVRAEEESYSGFYVGGGYGQSDFAIADDACENALDKVQRELRDQTGNDPAFDPVFAQFETNTDCNVDATDNAWKAYVGYQFSPYFALEAGYVDLGSLDGDFSTGYSEQGASISTSANIHGSITGVELVGILSAPLGDVFSVYAKAGVFVWQADLEGAAQANANIGGFVANDSDSVDDSDNGADLTWGGGARANLGRNVRVRADYAKYEVIDTSLITGNVEFIFR